MYFFVHSAILYSLNFFIDLDKFMHIYKALDYCWLTIDRLSATTKSPF